MKKNVLMLCIAASVTMLTGCLDNDNTPVNQPTPENPQPPKVLPEGLTQYGAGTVSAKFNPAGYICKDDHGFWVDSAGVVDPAVQGCDSLGGAIGEPVKRHPQVTGAAATKPVAAHRWWGSVPFLGEMTIGDVNKPAFITPDPVMARISNKGVRITSIAAGMKLINPNEFGYQMPDPFAEVFDGIAVYNTEQPELNALMKDSSDASVTVEWQADDKPVIEATFVHGSPYVFFKGVSGQLALKTLRVDGGEKGVFYQKDNVLGVWSNVAGNRVDYLIVGEGATVFGDVNSDNITVSNATNQFTLVILPAGKTAEADIQYFASKARNVVDHVTVDYQVDTAKSDVTVSHYYLDAAGKPVETIAGMFPLHWKNADSVNSLYSIRSARGTVKYQPTSSFSYTMPFSGVLPYMPTEVGEYDMDTLRSMVTEFISQDPSTWNTHSDTYWSGKMYGKVAELIAISRSIDMNVEADKLTEWLKSELADWFVANTSGELDKKKYFVYDEEWNTLLGVNESFGTHQQLNDHHFHYGYFVRAAAEICRKDASWCGDDQFGPMIDLLIRDYAAGRDDDMFPYLRHFDPANGFSWASGQVNFMRGNNNESTSEAANAYGAMVLYGLITGDQALVERGMYLHASTAESYWQYWNNIDRFKKKPAEYDNFIPQYDKITTSIIWGDGAVFSTWFSPKYTHILGIQGLPANPLTLYIAQYPEYMKAYTALGLSESPNKKPSGLGKDDWADIWWNLWAMSDAKAAIADYNTKPDYTVEAGESRAHTYHWLHTWKNLGQLLPNERRISANDPAAVVFEQNGQKTYVGYNYGDSDKTITFSDGTTLTVKPNSFATLKK